MKWVMSRLEVVWLPAGPHVIEGAPVQFQVPYAYWYICTYFDALQENS